MAGPHAPDLGRNAANHVALSPVSFLRRAAETWPGKVAVRHGDTAFTYAQLEARCRRLASALLRRGIGRGDTVAIMAPNSVAKFSARRLSVSCG